MKDTYDKPTVNFIFSSEKLKAFSLKSGTRQEFPLSPFFFQHNFGGPSHGNQRRKKEKRKKTKITQIGKEEVTLLVCR